MGARKQRSKQMDSLPSQNQNLWRVWLSSNNLESSMFGIMIKVHVLQEGLHKSEK